MEQQTEPSWPVPRSYWPLLHHSGQWLRTLRHSFLLDWPLRPLGGKISLPQTHHLPHRQWLCANSFVRNERVRLPALAPSYALYIVTWRCAQRPRHDFGHGTALRTQCRHGHSCSKRTYFASHSRSLAPVWPCSHGTHRWYHGSLPSLGRPSPSQSHTAAGFNLPASKSHTSCQFRAVAHPLAGYPHAPLTRPLCCMDCARRILYQSSLALADYPRPYW